MPELVPLDSLISNNCVKKVEISSSYFYSQMSRFMRAGNQEAYNELARIVSKKSYLVVAAGGSSFNVVNPYVTVDKVDAVRFFNPADVYVRAAF